MNRLARKSSLLLILLVALPAASDDQQKAQKLLTKITALATDPNGRRAVSLAVSDTLSVGRPELARRRHAMNINYGDLFLAYYLNKSGAKLDDIAAQMRSGQSIWQIANQQHPNWKQLASDAKKLNGRVDDNLLRHFANVKADAKRNLADGYDPFLDSVAADSNVSQEEIIDAENRYNFLHDHAGVISGARLDTSDEQATRSARPDPVRNGGPQNPDTNTRPGPN